MMNDAKRIPYGVSNFVEVVEQNQYYVDKTQQFILYTPEAFRQKYFPEHASCLL